MAPADRARADVLARPLQAARRATAAGARGSRADFREIRPDAVDAARSAASRHRRRTRQAAGSRAAVSQRAGDGDAAARLWQADRPGFQVLRPRADRQRIGRAGALGRASRRHACCGQGAAAKHRGDHRKGSRPDADGRGAGGEVMVRRQAAAAPRSRRRIRQDHSRRTRSGCAKRPIARSCAATSCTLRCCWCPRSTGTGARAK